MSEIKYSNQLDGVRAFCIIITILCHVEGTPRWINGTVGVDIFFALSGFLITKIMFAERARTGRISVASFYIRRFFRIAPLYFIAFFMTALASVVIYRLGIDPSKYQKLLVTWPWIVTFNRELCATAVCGDTYFGHAWSIGIEEKFYIVWPLVFGALATWRKGFFLALVCLAVMLLTLLDGKYTRGYAGIIFGCMVSYLDATMKLRMSRAFAVLMTCLLVAGYLASLESYYGNLLVSFASAWLILMLFRARSGFFVDIFAARPVAWVGGLTYGVYLFHVLAINLVEYAMKYAGMVGYEWRWLSDFFLAYAVSVSFAYFMARFVELPMIGVGRSISARLAVRRDSSDPAA